MELLKFVVTVLFAFSCLDRAGSSPINPCPTIVTRSEWGARESKSKAYLIAPVKYAFIHHTYIPKACYTKEDCIKKVQHIQNFHMDDRGWDDIGYSYLIGGDGNVYEGRGWDRVGAHTKHFNTVGLGFSIIGDYSSKLPSPTILRLVQNLIACGVAKGKLRTNYTLRGHRDMSSTTECPGDALYAEIRTWPHY